MRLGGKSSRKGPSKLILIMCSSYQDVIETLETIAENVLNTTGFFHNGLKPGNENESGYLLQNGVCRTNCIDCLDRTNAGQVVFRTRPVGTGKWFHLRRHHIYSSGVYHVLPCLYSLCPPAQSRPLHNCLYHDLSTTILGLLQLSLPAHHQLSTNMFYIMRLIIREGLRRAVGTRAASHICTEQFYLIVVSHLIQKAQSDHPVRDDMYPAERLSSQHVTHQMPSQMRKYSPCYL